MADLAGQVALITGASSGIGLHLARGLAERGMAVAGLARGADRLAAAMAEVARRPPGRACSPCPADVTDRAAVEAAVARVTEELGHVDLLVNNAGLIDAAEVPLWEADPDQWWDVVASHVRGSFLLCRTVVPWMLLRNRGRVVNIASGQSVRVHPEYSAYGVAKTGLMRITEALRRVARGLRRAGVRPRPRRRRHPDDPLDVACGRARPTGRRRSESSSSSPPSPPGSSTSGPAGSCAWAPTTRTPGAHDAGGRRPPAPPAALRGRRPARPDPRLGAQKIVASARGAMSTATGVSASSSTSSPSSCSGMGASGVNA